MKKKTINALIEMGMPADLRGFQYIVDAICLMQSREWRNGKTTVLYHEIGKLNGITASQVERAMRHAFGTMINEGDPKMVKKYLTFQKPTNGNLLHVLYYRLAEDE